MNLLRIDGSMRKAGSLTRELTDELVAALDPVGVVTRDLADGAPLIDEAWIEANFTADEDRTPAQRAALAGSDALVAELQAADTVVIGLPIYNFGVPAAVKAWVDQIARARLTFRYAADGPEGLLSGKTAYLVVASGGVPVGGAADFATAYMRHALAFVGIEDVRLIDASAAGGDAAAALARARAAIPALKKAA